MLAYQHLVDLVRSGRVDLVTSDVFDTLVTRPVATPSDLFVRLGERLHTVGVLDQSVTPRTFAEGRKAAEHRARQHAAASATVEGAAECRFEDIWAQMPGHWFADGRAEQALQIELECEGESLRPIAPLLDAFRAVAAAGVPIVLVSDIYFSAEQLRHVLSASGVHLEQFADVVASSDHGFGKGQGLLRSVIERRGVESSRVVHVGDNEDADVRAALDLGAHAIATDLMRQQRHVSVPSEPLVAASALLGTDGGVSAVVRSALLADPDAPAHPAFQFGAAIGGPLLAGFATWIADQAEELGNAIVQCMLREGATIANAVNVVSPSTSTRLLHASRWVYMRAAVVDGTVDEIAPAVARRAALHPAHFVEAFGCDEQLVAEVLGTSEIPAHSRADALATVADHEQLRSQIVESSAAVRKRLTRYLDTALAGAERVVLCDVGWGGTIQEGLERVMRTNGDDRPVTGLYLALSSTGEHRIARGHDLRSYLPNIMDVEVPGPDVHSRTVAHHADVVERLLTPQLGTLLDIDDDGRAVCAQEQADEILPSLQRAQEATLDVVRRLAEWGIDRELWAGSQVWRSALGESMANVIAAPQPSLAEVLGQWPHDDVAGTAAASIANPDVAELAPYLNAAELDSLNWADATWLPGVLGGRNPALLATTEALRSGAAAAHLCPPSEAGPVRVSVFEMGSLLAADESTRLPLTNARGWSIVRLPTAVRSLRSVRFDSGVLAALTDVALLRVRLHLDDGDVVVRDIADLTDSSLTWVDAVPIDARRFAHRPGGHLIIPIDPALGERCRKVDVDIAFRVWLLDGEHDRSRADRADGATTIDEWISALGMATMVDVVAEANEADTALATPSRSAQLGGLARRVARRAATEASRRTR